MNKKIQKLYFLMILLFCSSVNAFENTEDNTAELKKVNIIQAGAIQDLMRKKFELQEALEEKARELEDAQNNSSNTSDNSHSSSNTGQRTTGGNSVSPEQYISNNRNTQDNASSQINSKVYVNNDDKNLDVIKVPNITDPVQKPNSSQTNQSQSAILGDSNQQELMLGDNKQSNNQINQLDSDGEPLETHENTSKFELLQSDIKEAEAKLLELQTKEDNLNNAYMEKKLAFEKLEQLQSQLPKQSEIKDNSLNQLQNQEVQKNVVENVAGLQGILDTQKKLLDDSQQQIKFLKNEIKEKKGALEQAITNHHTGLKKQESQSVAKLKKEKPTKKTQGKIKDNSVFQNQLKSQLKKIEKNAKNQLATLSAEKGLRYNALNTDLQANLAEDRKDHEQVQQELEKKKEENKYLQEQITTLGKDKAGLGMDLVDARNKAEALTIAQQVKGDALKALQDQLAAAVKDHKEKEKQFAGQIADLNQAHAEQDALVKAKEEELNKLQEAQTKEKQEALKEQARLAEAVEAREKQIADLTEEKAKKDQQIADLNQAQKDMTKAKDDAVKQLAEKGKEIEALTEAHKAKEQKVADLLKEKQAALQEQAKLAEAVDAQQVKEQEHAVQMADLLKEKQAKDDALKVAQDKLDETVKAYEAKEQEHEAIAALNQANEQALELAKKEFEENKKQLEKNLVDAEKNAADMTKVKDDAVKELAEKGKEIETLTEVHKAKEQAAKEQKILEEKIVAFTKEIADLNEILAKEKQVALEENAKLAEAFAVQQDVLAKNQQELLGLNQEREKIAKELANLTKAQAKKEQEYEAKITALTEEKHLKDEEFRKVEGDYEEAQQKLVEEQNKFKEENKNLQEKMIVLEEGKKRLDESLANAEKNARELQAAQNQSVVELKSLQDKFAETLEAHAAREQELKIANEKVAKKLEDLTAAHEAKEQEHKTQIEDLTKINEHALELAQKELIEKETKLKEESEKFAQEKNQLEEKLSVAEKNAEALTKVNDEALAEKAKLAAAVEDYKKQIDDLNVEKDEMVKAHKVKEQEVADLATTLAKEKQAKEKADKELAALTKTQQEKDQQIAALTKVQQNKDDELKVLQVKLAEDLRTHKAKEQEETNLVKEKEQLVKVHEEKIEVVTKEIADLNQTLAEKDKKITDLNAKQDETLKALTDMTKVNDEALAEQAKLAAVVEAYEKQITVLNAGKDAVAKELEAQQQKVIDLNQTLADEEQEIVNLTQANEEIVKDLEEKKQELVDLVENYEEAIAANNEIFEKLELIEHEMQDLAAESELYKQQIEEKEGILKGLEEKERELEVALEKLKDDKGDLTSTDSVKKSKTITQQQEQVRMMKTQITQELTKAKRELAAATLFADNKRLEARGLRRSANRAFAAAQAYLDGRKTEVRGLRRSADKAFVAAQTYANDKRLEVRGLRSGANRAVTVAQNHADNKRLEARGIKKDAERKLSKANVEAQAIKSKAAKILKDVGKNFADAQRTAANAKKTKVSEGQDVTTANLESQALVEVQQKLNEVEQQLIILTETIAEKGQEIDNLIGTIGRKDQEIADLTNVLEEKGQEIVTLTNTIKTKEQEIKESNNTHKEEEQKLKEQHKKMVDGLNEGFKNKEQELKEQHKKIVEGLNEGFKNKEQKLKSEKDTTQKNLTDLTKDYKKQEKELKISNQNLSNLTNSYKASGQATAQQKKDAKKIQELETRITDLKQNHSNELAEYQKENQSLKRQIALNETKQANDAALKHNMCELAQQELVDTQQAMKELKQLPPSDVADSRIKKLHMRYSNTSSNLTKSSDPLNEKVDATNLLVKQQSNKAPVVILKAFPTKVASPVNIVGTEASNVLREQNSSQLATPKRSVTKIDPIIVKKDTDGIDNTKLPSNTLRKSATTTRTSVDKISHGYISRKEEPRQIGGQSYPRNK